MLGMCTRGVGIWELGMGRSAGEHRSIRAGGTSGTLVLGINGMADGEINGTLVIGGAMALEIVGIPVLGIGGEMADGGMMAGTAGEGDEDKL